MRHDLSAILDRRKEDEADIIWMAYHAPEGDGGLHTVKSLATGEKLIVGSAQGTTTFAPGTIVPVGRPGGAQRKFILGSAPPGAAGGGTFAARVYPAFPAPPAPSICPPSVHGTHLGIADDGNFLYAYLYNNGTYSHRLAKTSYAGLFSSPTTLHEMFTANRAPGDVVLMQVVDASGFTAILTWDLTTGFHLSYPFFDPTLYTPSVLLGPVYHSGTDFYFISDGPLADFTNGQVYKATLGSSGNVGAPIGAQNGLFFHDGIAATASHIWASGCDQVFNIATSAWVSRTGYPERVSAFYDGFVDPGLSVGGQETTVTIGNVWDGLPFDPDVGPNSINVILACPLVGADYEPFPRSWRFPFPVGFKSSPDRTRLVGYPFSSPSDLFNFSYLLTIRIGPGQFPDTCPLPIILVDTPPSGDGPMPQVMLPRD